MVSYEVPKPPQGFFSRMRDGMRLVSAFVKGDRATIADITAQTVFSPLQPISSATPQIVGRTWDYAPGINVQYLPRGYGSGRIPFPTLRAFSRNCEMLRLGIETVKDQIGGYSWRIVPKEGGKGKPEDQAIKDITAFLRKPDKTNHFDQWIRMLVEEFVVTDAVAIYRRKDRIGRPYSFEVIDGATIKPLIDADGCRPMPPDPAYQQIIKGAPRAFYDTTELLYFPRNVLAYDPTYGLSIVEQIITTAQTAIERAKLQQAYFTHGSLPDAYATLPEGMTQDQIKYFEDNFNDILSGNLAGRRGVPFLPGGTVINSLKQPPLKDEFDEWLARIVAYALGLSPTWAVKQMNRSTADTDQKREEEQGQGPKLQYLAICVNELLEDFGPEIYENYEFKFQDNNEIDAKVQNEIEDKNVRNATSTINEIRLARGQDPKEGGDQLMVLTASGYVPLDSYSQNQEMARQTMDAKAKAEAEQQNKPTDEEDANKALYGRLDKGERIQSAVPFPVRSCGCKKKP